MMNTTHAIDALRALSQPHRLAAFRALVRVGADGLSVGELREHLQIPPATLSAHLNRLRAANLIHDQREGRVIRVRAGFAHMDALLAFLTENCCGGQPCTPDRRCGVQS